ncbi:hypothetical protein QQ020_20695 [Fulvivirgaceae bacterium BMA12]|uniref:Lipoprotein n=1 Tax=Agaribacillus aureus TaxID=3051825 RepID=A0ABT8L9T5_9BACT|nr:hypothetical protein [Fulvivirgaceae bacterium BMA12]
MRLVKLIFLFSIIGIAFFDCSYSPLQNNSSESKKIDSVMNIYFTILDKTLKGEEHEYYDDWIDVPEASKVLSLLSGIASKSDGTFLGTIDITRETYDEWFEWYRNNKNVLIWEEDKKRVNRRDKNVFWFEDEGD